MYAGDMDDDDAGDDEDAGDDDDVDEDYDVDDDDDGYVDDDDDDYDDDDYVDDDGKFNYKVCLFCISISGRPSETIPKEWFVSCKQPKRFK